MGQPTPRCPCDTSSTSTNCTSENLPTTDVGYACYDWYKVSIFSFRKRFLRKGPAALLVNGGVVGLGTTDPKATLHINDAS